jgi:hypothetical protein
LRAARAAIFSIQQKLAFFINLPSRYGGRPLCSVLRLLTLMSCADVAHFECDVVVRIAGSEAGLFVNARIRLRHFGNWEFAS